MASPFSYSNDIAPMQQKFFGDVASSRDLSAAQKNRLIGASIGNQLKFNESLMKLQESQMTNRLRDLQFEEANMRLRKTKDDLDRQKDIMRDMPLITQELEAIRNDPDENSQTRRLSIFGIKNASKISNVPEVDQAFRSAALGINRGSQPRPAITYGDLVMKGVPTDVMGLTDATDINSAVPSTLAAKAIRYIADDAAKKEQAKKEEAALKERQDTVSKLFEDTSSFLQKADFNTSDDAFELAGRRVMPFVPTPKQEEFQTIVQARKALLGSKNNEAALRAVNDKLRTFVQDTVLSYDPTKFGSTPTESPTTSATRSRFSTTPTTK